jgi:hypothetical protein
MSRIHPKIDKQQVRSPRRVAAQLAEQVDIVRGGKHMDCIGDQQNIMTRRQRIADQIALDHVDSGSLRLAREPPTSHLASARQLE